MIFLYTDFGAADIYVGQVKSVLYQEAPEVTVVDLLHDAPAFDVRAGAHLLAALALSMPQASTTLAVIDPGVGSARAALVVNADGRWFVGPDNGLMSVVASRAAAPVYWHIAWRPERLTASFHGRDLFAPMAAAIARGELPADRVLPVACPDVDFGSADLAAVIYLDHYGNAYTGLRAPSVARTARIVVRGQAIAYARVFSEVPAGQSFWYENSLGLVELAANGCSAAATLDLRVGESVGIVT